MQTNITWPTAIYVYQLLNMNIWPTPVKASIFFYRRQNDVRLVLENVCELRAYLISIMHENERMLQDGDLCIS